MSTRGEGFMPVSENSVPTTGADDTHQNGWREGLSKGMSQDRR